MFRFLLYVVAHLFLVISLSLQVCLFCQCGAYHHMLVNIWHVSGCQIFSHISHPFYSFHPHHNEQRRSLYTMLRPCSLIVMTKMLHHCSPNADASGPTRCSKKSDRIRSRRRNNTLKSISSSKIKSQSSTKIAPGI